MLVSLGLDHRRASLETRERFHLEDEDVCRVSHALRARGACETVLTRTCNRVEVYSWWSGARASSADAAADEIGRAWVGERSSEVARLRRVAQLRTGSDAARHLFRVSSGLESQILGDIHIQGQVRRALREAVAAQSIGAHLQRLFETALAVGKRVKRNTGLMATRSSVGSEAAVMANAQVGGVAGRSCVIVGCGKSGTQAAWRLSQLGAGALTVLNRTTEKAEQLARDLATARGAGLEGLAREVARADVVIVATGAPEPVLTASDLEAARAAEGSDRPLLIVDVSVPRNVEPGVGSLDGVDLRDLDGLHVQAAEIERSRLRAVPEAERLVQESVEEFARWLKLRDAGRALDPFHEILVRICRRELTHLAGASSQAARTADRIVAAVMAHPMTALRRACERGEPLTEAAQDLAFLFGGVESAPDHTPTRIRGERTRVSGSGALSTQMTMPVRSR